MSRRGRWAGVGALVVSLGLLAGCGGDDEDASSGAASGGGGDPIKVMVISSKDSQLYNYPGMWEVAKAYIGDLNERGGINGRQVEMIECNDRADPNLSERCARDAESEGAVALVGGMSAFDARIIPLIEKSKIPWIGSNPLSPQAYTSAMTFTGNPVPFTYMAAVLEAAKDCESPVAAVAEGVSESLFETFDMLGIKAEDPTREFGTVVTVPSDVADITPYVADLTKDSPDCIWSHLQIPQQQKLLPELAKLDNPPRYYVSTTALSQDVLDAAPEVLEGAVIGAGFPHPNDPIWDDAKAAIEEYANPEEAHLSDGPDASSWIAFKIFEEVASTIDGEITKESMLEALGQASAIDTGGLTGTIDYSKPFEVEEFSRLMNRSAFLWTIEDGEIVAMSDGPVDLSDAFVKGYENTH